MDFNKYQYKRISNSFKVSGNVLLCLIAMMISFYSLTAEDFSLNNFTGAWTDNDPWVDGTAPNTCDIKMNIFIYNDIRYIGNIFFKKSDLHVYDPLVIFEILRLGNNANYFIYSGGILIARGDHVS